MKALDIILLACFLPALWHGLRKGLVSQLISMISLLLGIWVSYKFSVPVAAWLGKYAEASPVALKVASYVVIFLGVAILLGLVRVLLEKVLKFAMLGWVNKLFGALLSVVITAFILGLAIMLFNSVNVHYSIVDEEVLAACPVYTHLKDLAYSVFPYMKEMLF